MKQMNKWSPAHNKLWYVLAILLVLPALLINLNLVTLIEDEGIRSLVALEMMYSDNWIVPTLNGEYYYKKPPLFNWIILFFYKIFGVNEWAVRMPTIVSLVTFAYAVYYYGKQYLSEKTAFLAAIALITCGRFLIYDSLFGLIDTCFSLVVFIQFMSIFRLFEKQKLLLLFTISYALTAIAFLLKGLPALAFQALSLLAYFTYKKRFKTLFSWQHIVGILLLFLLLGSYYFSYATFNDLNILFSTTLDENTQRTAINNEVSIVDTFAHLLSFPFEMLVYHFLPWTVLFIVLIKNGFIEHLKNHQFLKYCGIIFLANIWIYWLSSAIYPRYLFMFLPLQFYILFYFEAQLPEKAWQKKFIQYLFGFILMVSTLASPAFFFVEALNSLPYALPTALFLVLMFSFLSYSYYQFPKQRLLIFGVFLLTFRLGFSVYVFPIRSVEDKSSLCRADAIHLGERYKDKDLKIIGKKDTYAVYSYFTNSFYFSANAGYILERVEMDEVKQGEEYLLEYYLEEEHLSRFNVIDSMRTRHQLLPLKVVTLKEKE